MGLLKVVKKVSKLGKFIPGHARRVKKASDKVARAKKFARRAEKIKKLKQQKKLDRVKNIRRIRRERLSAERRAAFSAKVGRIKDSLPGVARSLVSPGGAAAGLGAAGAGGFLIGRRKRSRHSRRR